MSAPFLFPSVPGLLDHVGGHASRSMRPRIYTTQCPTGSCWGYRHTGHEAEPQASSAPASRDGYNAGTTDGNIGGAGAGVKVILVPTAYSGRATTGRRWVCASSKDAPNRPEPHPTCAEHHQSTSSQFNSSEAVALAAHGPGAFRTRGCLVKPVSPGADFERIPWLTQLLNLRLQPGLILSASGPLCHKYLSQRGSR